MNRFFFFAHCALLLVTLGFAQSAGATTVPPATPTIESTVDAIMLIVKSPDMKNPALRPGLQEKIENIVQQIFDFEEFSARTVGPAWRSFTPDEKARFIEAFSSMLRASYLDKIDEYDGDKVQYTGEVRSTRGDKAEVQTILDINKKSVPVAYRLVYKKSAWMVYDVLIERVSLVENYRGQFKDLLATGKADDLIRKVEEKAEEIRLQNKTGKSS